MLRSGHCKNAVIYRAPFSSRTSAGEKRKERRAASGDPFWDLFRTHLLLRPTRLTHSTHWFPLLTSPFSLLISHFALRTSHFSLLTFHFSLRTSHFSLLFSQGARHVFLLFSLLSADLCLCKPCSVAVAHVEQAWENNMFPQKLPPMMFSGLEKHSLL